MFMKSTFTLLFAVLCFSSMAQLSINPNPSGINSGAITITYGAQGDYSLFDPMSNPNLLLYTGLETDGVASTWDYHDDFTNTATFIPFNFDNNVGAYVAQIDVANRTYQEEPSLNVVSLPQGLQVNDFYFLIITTDLSRQSADLKGSDYGWQAATLRMNDVVQPVFSVIAVGNTLHFSEPGIYDIRTYELSGKLVYQANEIVVADVLALSSLELNGIYVTQIIQGKKMLTFKHVFDN